MYKNKGKICLIISAFIYGLAPVLAKYAYREGVNEVTLSFLRTFLGIPLLLISIWVRKISLKLTASEFWKIFILSVFGGALAIILLYISYNYISAGLATTLHFIYPILIIFASAIIYHEKISKMMLAAALLVTIGIFMFSDIESTADKVGIIAALLSGVFYSFYVIYLDKSGLNKMDYVKLTFYFMLMMSTATFIFGLFTNSIDFSFSNEAWTYSWIISVIITLGAIPLLQAGVRYEGAATAGILSTIEPITTIVLGAIFLGEIVGIWQYVGCVLIIMGVIISQRK